MERTDICYYIDEKRFNFRVAGLIECEDMVLLQNVKGLEYWNLPGGRVKIGETSFQALRREMQEELGLYVKSAQLFHVSENLYPWQTKKFHEMLFVYKIVLEKNHELAKKQDFATGDFENQTNRWVKKDDVENYVCAPDQIYFLVKKKGSNISCSSQDKLKKKNTKKLKTNNKQSKKV